MSRQYGKRKQNQILTLYGFEQWAESLQRAVDTDIDSAIEKCFNECADIVDEALETQMQIKKVPESLKSKKSVWKEHRGNVYILSDGWLKRDEESFLKVYYLNYGTPMRETKSGANRGKISARYFISNAKRSAAQRVRKVQKDALDKVLGDLKK